MEVSMSKYVFDASRIDTSPGNLLSPFSPPSDLLGIDDRQYVRWLRNRYRVDPNLKQRLGIAIRAVRLRRPLEISGNYSHVLLEIIETFEQKRR
jgi:hypothetical protein